MSKAATKKRGGDPDVKHKPKSRKARQRSGARAGGGSGGKSWPGSDPVNVTQPPKTKLDKSDDGRRTLMRT